MSWFTRRSFLALSLAMAVGSPALAGGSQSAAMKMSGQQWLQRMEKNRTDSGTPGSPLWVAVNVARANVAGHSLTISHGAIPRINMPAMTMTFPVADPTHLSMLHKGDPIDIQVVDDAGVVKILDFRMKH